MQLKTNFLIIYAIFIIAAFIAAMTKNPYFLGFDCTMILAILIDKSNYKDKQ